ncbi:homing endonuclease associated repeat-containing protein [Brevibacterium sp.]|uniref:homing endonuclease associated repeat-containing protein n=1 Tax=Brevibacterium sp. TaxID=1701 RepID=UPI002811CC21|nr:multidrug transporter [Brevibacterium sp.]
MVAVNEVANGKSHTSTPAVLGALLYVAAKERGVVSAGADASSLSADDREILAEVDVALRHQSSDEVFIESTLAEVTLMIAALRGLSEPVPLAAARYEARRSEVLSGLGVTSSRGTSIWPPTSQTAVQRFGSWNEALKAAGLATSSTGRAKGQLRFDAAAYDRTLGVFVADCEKRGVPATYKEYSAFAAERKGEVPSAAAVRKFYGSWNKALASAG